MDLRDIKVTDSNGDVYYQSPDVPVVCTPAVASVGATLMKTGQTTSYRTGDDGDLEKGRATSFLVLASNNPFGNTNRFTDELGGQTYTNDIVIDWSTYDGSTVLGWYDVENGVNITWANAIDAALLVSVSTFTTGWRLPNITEMHSTFNFAGATYLWLQSQISVDPGWNYWTSTSDPRSGGVNAWRVIPQQFIIATIVKTSSTNFRYIPCRTFTVTGTTLS